MFILYLLIYTQHLFSVSVPDCCLCRSAPAPVPRQRTLWWDWNIWHQEGNMGIIWSIWNMLLQSANMSSKHTYSHAINIIYIYTIVCTFITLIYVYYRNQKDLVLILYCSYYFEHVVDSSDHVMMDTTPLDDLGLAHQVTGLTVRFSHCEENRSHCLHILLYTGALRVCMAMYGIYVSTC